MEQTLLKMQVFALECKNLHFLNDYDTLSANWRWRYDIGKSLSGAFAPGIRGLYREGWCCKRTGLAFEMMAYYTKKQLQNEMILW